MKYEFIYNGKEIPVIGMGTWKIGGEMNADYSHDDESIKIIRKAIKIGYTHIDTAQMYGGGHTEELVGRAIKPFKRENLFITTKVWSNNLGYRDVLQHFELSLKKLETAYVDLLLIHWPNPDIPLKETFKAFNEIVDKGSVKYVGVSNFELEQLKQAQALSNIPIATDQVEYNVLSRNPERTGLLEYCQKNDILITAYQPLGKGKLFHNTKLNRLAARSNISMPQLAINWLIRKQKVITIPMSFNETHLRENFEAVNIDLSSDILRRLDRLSK